MYVKNEYLYLFGKIERCLLIEHRTELETSKLRRNPHHTSVLSAGPEEKAITSVQYLASSIITVAVFHTSGYHDQFHLDRVSSQSTWMQDKYRRLRVQ